MKAEYVFSTRLKFHSMLSSLKILNERKYSDSYFIYQKKKIKTHENITKEN